MPPQHPYAGDFPKSGSEEHENNVTIQDADNGGFSTAAFTHISSFIESLDDMLAGESENPTHEPYDEQFTAQAYAPLELDPATAENVRLEYEKYLEETREKPTPTPRIERVNEPDFFIERGVVTGTSYPLIKTSPATRRSPRNGQLKNAHVPDFNSNKYLWETREERLNAIDHQSVILDPRARLSEYFVWGISYNPPDELSQGHRAVHIGVPTGTSLKSILDNINTGPIYSATLCNTTAITGGLTAFIVFVDESGASRLKSNTASNTLIPVHITSHPTWPINSTMLQQIRQGWTRTLSIRGLSSTDILDKVKEVLEVQRDAEGCYRVEFSSIPAADKAFRLMSAYYRGSDVAVSFAADPCSLPFPVPFGAALDASSVTLTPASSFGSQDGEFVDDKASLVAKYGPPPVFRLSRVLPEAKDFSNLVPVFEYHGTSLNWADEMIDEAAEEEYRNAPALDILAQQALGEKVY